MASSQESTRNGARSRKATYLSALVFLIGFMLAGSWLALGIKGMSLAGAFDAGAALNPLHKQVLADNAGWLDNYGRYPLTMGAPVLGVLGALLAILASTSRRAGLAFVGSSLMIVGTICTAGFALFPFVFPSSLDAASSLTVWDAVSSHKTLGIMFVVACIFVPIILLYTLWSYVRMWGKLNDGSIEANPHGLY